MTHTPAADLHTAHVRAYWAHRIARPAAGYREAFADVLTHRRLEAEARQRRRGNGPELEILREGLREIIQIRLLAAYAPIMQTLDRMEWQFKCLSRSGADPWGPPLAFQPMPDILPSERPIFLQR